MRYTSSRYVCQRRVSREVMVGNVALGGKNPVRVQSMTTTDTRDVAATVKQSIELAEAGCEIVRITAPNKPAARALKDIRAELEKAKVFVPLVADIHFLPQAAMEAVEHVDKVRINPGNYADTKKFSITEYSDAQYEAELERLHKEFSPIVKRCKELGRAMRIGTNHGSLSDRIMNRYGDSPLGMVESALEFIRICESHNFRNIVLSMKASNPKVMIEAYRLVVEKMNAEGMNYPLHLGVTEAGDGEDGRIKSSIGIGTLLYDGLGDTIRVSLTEDPIHEIPVAQALAQKAHALWEQAALQTIPANAYDSINPFSFKRRETATISFTEGCALGQQDVPRVIGTVSESVNKSDVIIKSVLETHNSLRDKKIEGLHLLLSAPEDFAPLKKIVDVLSPSIPFFVLQLPQTITPENICGENWISGQSFVLCTSIHDEQELQTWLAICAEKGCRFALDTEAAQIESLHDTLATIAPEQLIITQTEPRKDLHPLGNYRLLVETLRQHALTFPLWIRVTEAQTIQGNNYFSDHLMEASILAGALLCDGLGDAISIENEPSLLRATNLAYNLLQGARARVSKTEYVACPSCGRTLFDLQSTTQKIRERTDHLKGVTIAVMGCIVNGPGEMADADFGYVGGAPKKINLYVGKTPVKHNIPEEKAVDELIALIKEHGKWQEAPALTA